jgi:hypothetical protein
VPRSLVNLLFSLALAGCIAIPLEGKSTPTGACGRQGEPCQRELVMGLFPAIGEAHLNDVATNGKPLTPGLYAADYTLRPLFIMAVNVISLGFPTLTSWLLEPYEDYDSDAGHCSMALLGYCKSAKLQPGEH